MDAAPQQTYSSGDDLQNGSKPPEMGLEVCSAQPARRHVFLKELIPTALSPAVKLFIFFSEVFFLLLVS